MSAIKFRKWSPPPALEEDSSNFDSSTSNLASNSTSPPSKRLRKVGTFNSTDCQTKNKYLTREHVCLDWTRELRGVDEDAPLREGWMDQGGDGGRGLLFLNLFIDHYSP